MLGFFRFIIFCASVVLNPWFAIKLMPIMHFVMIFCLMILYWVLNFCLCNTRSQSINEGCYNHMFPNPFSHLLSRFINMYAHTTHII